MITTYRLLAEEIRTTLYSGIPNDDAFFSLNHIAMLVATEVAAAATQNLFANSNAGEASFANDTFLVTYKDLAVSYDDDLLRYSFTLPDIPAGLPSNREITRVWATGSTGCEFYPMNQKDVGVQNLIGSIPGRFFFVEGAEIAFYGSTKVMPETVNMTSVGGAPSGSIIDATVNVPKNYQQAIIRNVLALLDPVRFKRDVLNDSVDKVTA